MGLRGLPLSLVAVAVFVATTSQAAIFLAPQDGELIDSADAIVIGTVTQMNGEFVVGRDGVIATMIDIDVKEVLKGAFAPGARIRIGELGGTVGSATMGVSAAPKYWRRNHALVFLQRTGDGQWRTWGAMLGKFDFVTDRLDRNLAVRWANEEDMTLWSADGHPVDNHLRDAQGFLEFIRQRVQKQTIPPAKRRAVRPGASIGPAGDEADYIVDDLSLDDVNPPAYWDPAVNAHQVGYPPSAYTQETFRWDVFDKDAAVTFFVSGSQPGYDSLGAAQRGLAAWTSDGGSNIDYRYGGTRSLGFVQDGTNAIVFNNSTDVPSGAIAYARWHGGAYHTYKGERFISIFEGDVVVRSGLNVSQKIFDEAVTHELGHTLGFRHSDQGTPFSTQAVMKAVLSGVFGATLGPWDAEAAHAVYGLASSPDVGAPLNLVATATSTSTVSVTWSPATNATSYQVERSSSINAPFEPIATVTGTGYNDGGLAANTTYLYRVRAVNGSIYSNVDHATTVIFLDDPLVPGTIVKDEHITQLRTAIDALRIAMGLGAFGWTESVGPGVIIRAAHILELRSALTPALSARGIVASYTSLASGTVIRTIHIQELRNYVK